MRTGKEGRREGAHTKKIKSPGLSHLDNRRYFHSSSGSFDSTPLVYSTPPPPPFPSYRGGQRSVRTNVRRQAGRLVQPGHGPVCQGQTGGPGQGGEKTTQSVEQVIHLSQKDTKKTIQSYFCGVPWSVLCLLSVRTNSLFHSGDIFSGLFFAAANVTRAARKSKNGVLFLFF